MKHKPHHNLTQTDRPITIIRRIPWDEDVSRRIWEASRQQAAAHNRAVEELIQRPGTKLRRLDREGTLGLQGLWLRWREEAPALAGFLQAIWRPGVKLAKTRVDAWEATNQEQLEAFLTDQKNQQDDKAQDKKPQHSGRRKISTDSLFRRRKSHDRHHRNRLVADERIRTIEPKTIRVPGVGDVHLREALPDGFKIRSATFVERTPRARGHNLKPEERSWQVHLTTKVDAPLRPLPMEPKSIGGDHGVVHALTTSSSSGASEHLHYDAPEPTRGREYDRLEKKKNRCRKRRRGSRKRRALQRRQNRIRAGALRKRAEQRRQWARRIALKHDLVGIEHLRVTNMTASARGTSEQPGKGVAAKRGLDRRLQESAPGCQTTELINACIRHGTRYRLVPAGGTSITCAECGHRHRKNRETQAVFRCRKCGHEANADTNAAEVIRLLAKAYTRVGVSRPWAIAMVAERAEAAHRKARRARGASAAQRSTKPETRRPKPAKRRREAAPRTP